MTTSVEAPFIGKSRRPLKGWLSPFKQRRCGAALIRIEALNARRRWRDVEREGKRYAEQLPAGPRSAEAAFATAAAIEAQGRLAEAAGRFRQIWAESRADGWSQRAEARLASVATRLPPEQQAAAGKRRQDWVARGMVLFDRHQNEASESAFAVAGGGRAGRRLRVQGSLSPGPVGLEAAEPDAGGAAVHRGRAGLPARGRRRYPGARPTSAGAACRSSATSRGR